MLLGNGQQYHRIPLTLLGDRWTCFARDERMHLMDNSEGFTKLNSIPDGYYAPHAIMMPLTAGRLSTKEKVTGSGTVSSATMQSGYNIGAGISGSGTIPGCDIGLIVSIAAAITGSGTISSATVEALASMVAALTGSGSVTATAAGLADLTAALTGAGIVVANNTALMDIEATIVGYGALTPEGLRDAVWSQIVEAGFSAEQILRLLAAHAAGAATGLEGADMRYKGLDGTTTRIDGNYVAGTRTIDSLDAD